MSAEHKDTGKPVVADITYSLLEAIGTVLKRAQDSGKYPRYNWKEGGEITRFAASAIRHVFKYLDGVEKDEETGLPHLWHAACNLMFLIEWHKKGTVIDDRYHHDKPLAGLVVSKDVN